MLRQVRAVRYILPLREGSSVPALVEGDDLGMYVVKLRGAGQGPKALTAELVAGELGRAVGLNVPEIVLVDLPRELSASEPDPELVRASGSQRRPQRGARLPAGEHHVRSGGGPRPDAKTASRTVMFDAFVANVDRTARNPNLLEWHRQLWLIDHGASLYFHHGWSPQHRTEGSQDRFVEVRDHVLLQHASELRAAAASFAKYAQRRAHRCGGAADSGAPGSKTLAPAATPEPNARATPLGSARDAQHCLPYSRRPKVRALVSFDYAIVRVVPAGRTRGVRQRGRHLVLLTSTTFMRTHRARPGALARAFARHRSSAGRQASVGVGPDLRRRSARWAHRATAATRALAMARCAAEHHPANVGPTRRLVRFCCRSHGVDPRAHGARLALSSPAAHRSRRARAKIPEQRRGRGDHHILRRVCARRKGSMNMASKGNSLVANINRRKKAGSSRPRSQSTVSSAAYREMQQGWPHAAAKKAAKKKSRASARPRRAARAAGAPKPTKTRARLGAPGRARPPAQ